MFGLPKRNIVRPAMMSATRVALIIGLGVVVRLLMLLLIEPSAGGDGIYYLAAAQAGPDLYRPPLYSLFLSLLLSLGGFVYIAQSILTLAVSILAYRLYGLTAGVLIATSPFLIIYEYSILSETLVVALLFAGWMLLDKGRAVWAGILVGLAILTRDTLVLLPLFALPFGYLLGRARTFLIALVTAYLVVLPWPAYNYVAHDKFELSEGRLGFNLWVGTWERDGRWVDKGITPEAFPASAFHSPAERIEILAALKRGDDEPFKRVAIDSLAADPIGTVSTWVVRYPRLWLGTRSDQAQLRLQTGSAGWVAFKSAAWGLNLLILLVGLLGLAITRKWILAIPVMYLALAYIPFHNTETRYTLPAIPFLLLGVAMLCDRYVGSSKPKE